MLHLNNRTKYAQCLIGRWNRSIGRVGVAAGRVAVERAKGSLLWAHLTNAQSIAWRWPAAHYVVLQASNMMWVRPGMEEVVATLQMSASVEVPDNSQGKKALRKMLQSDGIFNAILAMGGREATPTQH